MGTNSHHHLYAVPLRSRGAGSVLQQAIFIFEPWQYSVKKGMAVVNTQLDDWYKKIKN